VDFSLILVIATFVTGLIWLIDYIFYVSRRARTDAGQNQDENQGQELAGPRKVNTLVEYSRSFFPVLLVVLVVRSFMFEPFRIPSSSMMPTLHVGDFIFVNKFEYGLRLPVTNTKILEIGEPDRGDVVVFKLPSAPSTNYIKRLIGLPGDRITYRSKRLYINDKLVPLKEKGIYEGGFAGNARLATEVLGPVEHDLLLMVQQNSVEGSFLVPEGHYFMMGDNRDNSRDSRYPGVGFIPENKIVGHAIRVWMNWDFPTMPLWSRIGNKIT
jgi:signal peptidase I